MPEAPLTTADEELIEKVKKMAIEATPSEPKDLKEKYIPSGKLRSDIVEILETSKKYIFHLDLQDGKPVLALGIQPRENVESVRKKVTTLEDYAEDIEVFALQSEVSTLGFGAPVSPDNGTAFGTLGFVGCGAHDLKYYAVTNFHVVCAKEETEQLRRLENRRKGPVKRLLSATVQLCQR
jgi:hypothetical protein